MHDARSQSLKHLLPQHRSAIKTLPTSMGIEDHPKAQEHEVQH